ncbi:MAG TPA: SUMF1/EgtB/PvdO family nonheme iron enzyme, partial [Kofleriaceae bacterium]|nr:SUMF1/EgtB/PvdO family nonheme iron enzyme [Kofleriaceae bacterium]
GEPRRPVTGIDWYVAHAYCRYLGKELPSSQQWVKAMRGGTPLPGGVPNPMPRRNLPWGTGDPMLRAQLHGASRDGYNGVADAGSHLGDVSPYGVLDLAGNAQEWTHTPGDGDGIRLIRGGGILKDIAGQLIDYMAIENPRGESVSGMFELGMRCVVDR